MGATKQRPPRLHPELRPQLEALKDESKGAGGRWELVRVVARGDNFYADTMVVRREWKKHPEVEIICQAHNPNRTPDFEWPEDYTPSVEDQERIWDEAEKWRLNDPMSLRRIVDALFPAETPPPRPDPGQVDPIDLSDDDDGCGQDEASAAEQHLEKPVVDNDTAVAKKRPTPRKQWPSTSIHSKADPTGEPGGFLKNEIPPETAPEITPLPSSRNAVASTASGEAGLLGSLHNIRPAYFKGQSVVDVPSTQEVEEEEVAAPELEATQRDVEEGEEEEQDAPAPAAPLGNVESLAEEQLKRKHVEAKSQLRQVSTLKRTRKTIED